MVEKMEIWKKKIKSGRENAGKSRVIGKETYGSKNKERK